MTEGATPALELVGVGKQYGAYQAVGSVSLQLPRGSLLTLLGPSGCGKSTLLRMVAGFAAPSAGEIRIDGQDVTRLLPERRPTAMVFQSYALFPHMSVFDNVAFGLRLRKLQRDELRRKVETALALVRMDGLARRYPGELSGGQQQRVALARCLVVEPQILLLDEPFGALDRHLREAMQIELRKLQKKLGITMLVVTHDQEEAFILSDYVAVMNAGAIEQFASPAELYDRPATRFVARFMGIPNLLPGSVSAGMPSRFQWAGSTPLTLSDAAEEGPAELALRPETLTLVAADDVRADLRGVLTFVTLIGSRFNCEVALGDTVLQVVLPRNGWVPAVGSPVGVVVDPAHAIVLRG